jgi:hypothetical protein
LKGKLLPWFLTLDGVILSRKIQDRSQFWFLTETLDINILGNYRKTPLAACTNWHAWNFAFGILLKHVRALGIVS